MAPMSDEGPEQPIDLSDAYSVKTPEDNKALYAKWAASYETSFVDVKKYRYPRAIAELFDRVVPHGLGNLIADVGCGTGLVGLYLSALRSEVIIDGLDISRQMLEQAGAKKRGDGSAVYRNLIEADLTQVIGSASGPYDCLISSGTFTHGHLGPDALHNLIPLVRKGGWFLIGVNAEHFAGRGFDKEFVALAESGQICAPTFEKIQVYDVGSPHYGDQSITARFMRL